MEKSRSPYKDNDRLRAELAGFLKSFRSELRQEVERTSAFFEMACLAYCVQYYRNRGYEVIERNVVGPEREYRFKLGPAGYPENFSYFEVRERPRVEGKNHAFEIRHNCLVEAAHEWNVFLCPDVSVILKDSIREFVDPERPNKRGKRTYYVPNGALQTFLEVKHFNPIPELLASFIGILHELKQDVFRGVPAAIAPFHIAPSLAVSGFGSYRVYLLKESLRRRFGINIFLGMFFWKQQLYAKKHTPQIRVVGTRSSPPA